MSPAALCTHNRVPKAESRAEGPAAPSAVPPVGAGGSEPPLGLGSAQRAALKNCLTPIQLPCLELVPKANFRQERAVRIACN